jgi:hypothetical protein
VAPGQLLHRPAAAPGPDREAGADQQLVGRHRRGPQAGEEVGGGDGARPPHRQHVELGVEGQGDGRVLGGRVGVGQRAADRAPVADLRVADERRDPGQQRHRPGHLCAVLDRRLGGGGAHPQAAVAALDAPQVVDAPDVDEVVEHGQAQGEEGDQALAPGQDLGLVAQLGQGRGRLAGGAGGVVLERCRLHEGRP